MKQKYRIILAILGFTLIILFLIFYKAHDINGVVVIDLPFDKIEKLQYCDGYAPTSCNDIKINYSRKYILIKNGGCGDLALGETICNDEIIGAAKLNNKDIDNIKNILSNDDNYNYSSNNKLDDDRSYISKNTLNVLVRYVKK